MYMILFYVLLVTQIAFAVFSGLIINSTSQDEHTLTAITWLVALIIAMLAFLGRDTNTLHVILLYTLWLIISVITSEIVKFRETRR